MQKVGKNLFYDENEKKYYLPTASGGFVWVPKASKEQIREAGYTEELLLEEMRRHGQGTGQEKGTEVVEKKEEKSTAVVPAEQEPFLSMDKRDEEQILAELRGEVIEEYVYSYSQGGIEKVRLSWAGIKAVAQKMGNISIEEIKIQETDTAYRVLAKARDVIKNITMFGVSEAAKTQTLRDGRVVPDPFALQKAVSKAQRNAIRALIPETVIQAMIAELKRKGGR